MRKKISLLWLLFFVSCSPKTPFLNLYEELKIQGLMGRYFKGKVFVEGEFSQFLNLPSGASYGDFYLGENYFLLRLASPLKEELFFQWDSSSGPRLIIPNKDKFYQFKDEGLKLPEFPHYFLGLKDREKTFQLKGLAVAYTFDHTNLSGTLFCPLFSLSWKIKEINQVDKLPPPLDLSGFKKKTVKLPF